MSGQLNFKTCLFHILMLTLAGTSCAKEATPSAPSNQKDSIIANTVSAELDNESASTSNTHDSDGKNKKNTTTLLYKNGESLFISKVNGELRASLISIAPANVETKHRQIIKILEETKADENFISKIKQRLKTNPRLKEDDFSLPLNYQNGLYEFHFFSDFQNNVYTLNYRFNKTEPTF